MLLNLSFFAYDLFSMGPLFSVYPLYYKVLLCFLEGNVLGSTLFFTPVMINNDLFRLFSGVKPLFREFYG